MKCVWIYAGLAFAGMAFAADQPVESSVENNIYQPARLEPSDERLTRLKMPADFSLRRFAELSNPRMIVAAPDGTVYVTQREPATLTLLRDSDGDGVADVQRLATAKEGLHGVAIHDGRIYLATIHEVLVAPLQSDGMPGAFKAIATGLPDAGQHHSRTLAVGPDQRLYLSVGTTCNDCAERAHRPEMATMLRMDLDGANRTIFASGLRNTIGFGWHPAAKRLFGWDHGMDGLGDDIPREELNELVQNADYGHPYVYNDGQLHPRVKPPPPTGLTPQDWARLSRAPSLMHTAHSAGMQLAFYTGAQFPAEYRNDAFVALRGSWNRSPPAGYEIARIRFDDKGAPKAIEPFVSGFLVEEGRGDSFGHLGRLAGVAVARDGSLLVSDDMNGTVYRIAYRAKTAAQAPPFGKTTGELAEFAGLEAAPRIELRAADFKQNAPIPDRNSAYHQGQSPALSWSGVPAQAQSLVLIMEDPDAKGPKPITHWLLANVPPSAKDLPAKLPEADRLAQLGGAQQGANITSKAGYYGPRPPAGEPAHRYHFQLFALDRKLDLPAGFTRHALLEQMRGHVLAMGELIGTYQRKTD